MNTPGSAHPLRPRPLLRGLTALALSASLLLSGCVSLRSVPVPAPGQSSQTVGVRVGDKVRVLTRSGEKLAFEVTALEPGVLVGKPSPAGTVVRVKYLDIDTLQVEQLNKTRTTLAATVVVIAVVAGILIAAGPPNVGPILVGGTAP